MKWKRWETTGLVLAAAWLWAACSSTEPVYYEYRAVDGLAWRQTDTLSFAVSLPDTGQADLGLWVEVRHRGDYPYRNLSIRMARTLTTPTDTVCQVDTLRLTLADAQGRWLGEGLANVFQRSFPAGRLHTMTPADLRFDLTPALPDSLLPGINDIGIRLE